jgi:hypothetical protein
MVTITPAQANRLTTLIAALSLSNTRANSHLYTDRVAEVPSIKIVAVRRTFAMAAQIGMAASKLFESLPMPDAHRAVFARDPRAGFGRR